tara:strand:+ start:289 stop:666 length:378 start_codon:yes stop_codon:yes gene_type:complete
MKEFVKQVQKVYNKMSAFQVKNDANGKVLSKDELMLHSIHLMHRWAELERALNSIHPSAVKVKSEYKDVPFHWEVMDEITDYIQNEYPSIYNEACDKVKVFRDEDGNTITKEEYAKINEEEYEDE